MCILIALAQRNILHNFILIPLSTFRLNFVLSELRCEIYFNKIITFSSSLIIEHIKYDSYCNV